MNSRKKLLFNNFFNLTDTYFWHPSTRLGTHSILFRRKSMYSTDSKRTLLKWSSKDEIYNSLQKEKKIFDISITFRFKLKFKLAGNSVFLDCPLF